MQRHANGDLCRFHIFTKRDGQTHSGTEHGSARGVGVEQVASEGLRDTEKRVAAYNMKSCGVKGMVFLPQKSSTAEPTPYA